MELVTKIIALSALVIGVLALERTWYVSDLQRRFREVSAHITQVNLNIWEAATTFSTRVHEAICHKQKASPEALTTKGESTIPLTSRPD